MMSTPASKSPRATAAFPSMSCFIYSSFYKDCKNTICVIFTIIHHKAGIVKETLQYMQTSAVEGEICFVSCIVYFMLTQSVVGYFYNSAVYFSLIILVRAHECGECNRTRQNSFICELH